MADIDSSRSARLGERLAVWWRRAAPFLGVMALSAAAALLARKWWSAQPPEWRSAHGEDYYTAALANWWLLSLLALLGSGILISWLFRRNEARTTTSPASGVAGVTAWAAAFTVVVLAVTTAYTNEANRDQLDLAERGQITDRFTKAIDQLGREEGAGQMAIRLGGIYALERIMDDSTDDERNVVEVLCAFVREHTRVGADPIKNPNADVQAALTVLGRRPNIGQPGFGRDARFGIVDLRHAPPQEVHLEKANLQGAHMEGAQLNGAFLSLANLRFARLEGADLEGTVLSGADLLGAHLEGAHLKGTYVGDTDLSTTVGLTTESLQEACTNEGTTFPPGVTGPVGKIAGCD